MKRATRRGHFEESGTVVRRLFIPPLALDRDSGTPLHRQIHAQIAHSIRAGAAEPGSRLPSTRSMTKILGVSRNTVMSAYDALAADGLIRGERGSGMRLLTHGRTPVTARDILRAAHYPARTLAVSDPDGNPLALNF